MIVVRLNGGLGNQMFQYAHGVALATKLDRRLALDLTYLQYGNSHGGFCLDQYCLNEEVVISNPKTIRRLAYKYLDRSILTDEWECVREDGFSFQDIQCNSNSKSLILDGYWQSEQYFKGIRKKIIGEFSPLGKPSDHITEIMNTIKNSESVSLHVRRGDYVTQRSANQTHGVLPIEYYRSSIERILDEMPMANFYIFSDDPDWVRSEFREKIQHDFICVSGSSSLQSNDLFLMSLCKHNIIANSSYSWWGAWLNMNKEKRVIAPRNWFKDTSINTQDLLPLDWLTI